MSRSDNLKEWRAVIPSSSVRSKPIRVQINDIPIVVFRLKDNVFALNDICPHRAAPLSEGCIKADELRCPYHGWAFSGDGRLLDIPGNTDQLASDTPLIDSYEVIDKFGLIWIKAKESKSEYGPFVPSIHDTHNYFTVHARINADLVDVIENFLDALHTHSVHSGIVRSSNRERSRCDVYVSNVDRGYQAEYIEENQQSGLLSGLFGSGIIKSIGRIRYPGVLEIEYLSNSGIDLSVVIYLHQEQRGQCKLIMRTYLRKSKVPFFLKIGILFPFLLLVFLQDKRILEKQYTSMIAKPDFKPIITKSDIMRPYIVKALSNDVEMVDLSQTILL